MNKPTSCKGCPLEHIGKGYVPPKGPRDSHILLVGEYPTFEDLQASKPFQGGTGRILSRLLKSAGIVQDHCTMDNVMRCQPPKGKLPKGFDPIECAIRHLFKDIKVKKPHIIIALGKTPLEILTGLDKIHKRRGSLLKSVHGKVLPTLHPLTVIRNQSMWFIVIADLVKAKKESLFPEYIPPQLNFNMLPTLTKVKAFSPQMTEPLGVDIETTWAKYWENALICVGFSTPTQTLCIPWLKQGGEKYWPPNEQEAVVVEIQRLLNHPTVYQNGFFDVQVLEAIGFTVKNFLFDTMLAHHLLYAELPHDLGFICSMHTPIPYYKDESKSDAGALALKDEVFRGYNCKDVYGTMLAASDLTSDLRSQGCYDHFKSVTMKLPRILLNMQKKGILVDTHTLKYAIIEYTVDVNRLTLEMEEFGIPTGDKALKKYLFTDLKLPVTKRSFKTKQPSLDKDAFEKLHKKIMEEKDKLLPESDKFKRFEKAEQALRLIEEKKTKSKILSTYLRGLPIANDGRIHSSWLQHGTKNQRLSSREPNMQNMPQKGIAKRIYVAKPGHMFYSLDYSQIELRIIAYEAKDFPLIEAFENGQDVHDLAARDLFNIPQGEKVPKYIRTFTKCCEYCIEGTQTVATLEGDIPIKDVKAGMWTYSWDGTCYQPTKIKKLYINGTKECIKISLGYGNGKKTSLTCTPDHKLLTLKEEWKEAGDFLPGDRLFPFKRAKLVNGTYREVEPFNNGERMYEHHWINGIEPGKCTHHIDGDGLNNNPSNLVEVSRSEHAKHHDTGALAEYNRTHLNHHAQKTHCKRGHEFTQKNTRITSKGSRQCLACIKLLREEKQTINHKVLQMEKVGKKNVYCIEVEHPSHNFPIGNAGVWVSNCWNYGGDITAVLRVSPGILSLREAKKAQKIYFEKRPALKLYRERIEKEVRATRSVVSPFGLKRIFFGSISENIRSAYNFPIQCGAAHVINNACIRLDRKGLAEPYLILQIHDALVFELPEASTTQSIVEEIKKTMEVPVYIRERKVCMPIDVEWGSNLDNLKEYMGANK